MGGSFPAIFWDGVGGSAANVHLTDAVPSVSLNLPAQAAPVTAARPALYIAPTTPPPAALPAILMPAAMEAAAQ
jgi:hypothetical protein